MIPGYNHNIKHKGRTFHVQTEDSGPGTPMIMTHVFIGGNIIASKKRQYGDVVKQADAEQEIRQRMQGQHKEMLHNLVGGKYDDVVAKFVDSGALPLADETPAEQEEETAGAAAAAEPPTAEAPDAPPIDPTPVVIGRAASEDEPPRTSTDVGIQVPSRRLPERAARPHRPTVEGLPGPAGTNVRIEPIGAPVSNDIEGLPPGAIPVTPAPIVVGQEGARGLGAAPPRRDTSKGFQKPDPAAIAARRQDPRNMPTQPGADVGTGRSSHPTHSIRKPFGMEIITSRPLDEVILSFLCDERGK